LRKAKISNHNGYPALMVDGEIVPPMAMTTESTDRRYLRALGEAGIKLFFVISDTPWLKPDALELLKRSTDALLDAVPDAFIILRVGLHPPLRWIKEHPEDLVTFNDGSTQRVNLLSESYQAELPGMYSLASARWREDGGKALRDFLAKVMQMRCGEHVIGCFLAAGGTSEWYYPGGSGSIQGDRYPDFSPAFRLQFSEVLREKYQTEAELKKAWQDENASFTDPKIPDIPSRYFARVDHDVMAAYEAGRPVPKPETDANIGSFLNSDRYQGVADFYQAWHYGSADSILHFARVVKDKTNGDMVVGAFYGSYGCTHFLEGSTASGVLRILDSGVVDFLAAPGLYENRRPGGITVQREMQDSFRLRNCMFVAEEDTRTHLASDTNRQFTGTHTPQDTITNMKRDFGRNVCEDLHAWWFDMDPEGGWYDDPDIMDLIRRQQQLAQLAYSYDRRKHNEIALIYDQESTHHVSQQTSVDLCHMFRLLEIHRIGCPVDYYFHDDLADPDMPDYRLYVFVNVFHLTDAERRVVDAEVKRNGQVVVWLYAPGFICSDRSPKLSEEYISELAGMRIRRSDCPVDPRFRLSENSHPAVSEANQQVTYGYFDRPVISGGVASLPPGYAKNSLLYPMFYSADPEVTVAGCFLATGKPALSIREFADWTSIYCGAKTIRSDLLKSIARFAGCHIYSDTDDCLYANRHFAVIHAANAGTKQIHLPRVCDPYEVYQRRYYGRSVRELRVTMKAGETMMFHLDGEC